MLQRLRLAGFAVILASLCATPAARAAELNGHILDGHLFYATVYGPQGAEPAVVGFNRDEARVQLLDGEGLVIVLYNRSLNDMHFVTGKSLDGRFYRLDLNDTPWLYGNAMDPFFMPYAPGNLMHGPPLGGGHHGGHHGGD
ncbi:MAG: hypothetical protein M3Z37_10000 [Candidatus Eremiobacteraeota bacterium]|nr:hypothetical protein [Candidatus Eremiobacteraeota bacterium]